MNNETTILNIERINSFLKQISSNKFVKEGYIDGELTVILTLINEVLERHNPHPGDEERTSYTASNFQIDDQELSIEEKIDYWWGPKLTRELGILMFGEQVHLYENIHNASDNKTIREYRSMYSPYPAYPTYQSYSHESSLILRYDPKGQLNRHQELMKLSKMIASNGSIPVDATCRKIISDQCNIMYVSIGDMKSAVVKSEKNLHGTAYYRVNGFENIDDISQLDQALISGTLHQSIIGQIEKSTFEHEYSKLYSRKRG